MAGTKFVGTYFHTLRGDGSIEKQGIVLERVEEGYYMVEWFSWLDGDPNGRSLVSLGMMHDWRFYATGDEMRDAYSQYKPYGPDGQLHRCAEGMAAYRQAKVVPIAPHVPEPSFSGITATRPYSAPVERSEVQELRHAVQRLSRAVEMLTEVVQELAAREMTRT